LKNYLEIKTDAFLWHPYPSLFKLLKWAETTIGKGFSPKPNGLLLKDNVILLLLHYVVGTV
jgi:hypothetical protein